MHPITVVALGPGSPDLLTLGALSHLKKAKQVLLRTSRHGVVKLLEAQGIAFHSLDALYEQAEDFDAFTQAAAQAVIQQAALMPLTYAVADPSGDASVRLLVQLAGEHLRILPGVPLASPYLQSSLPPLPVLISSAVDLPIVNAQQALCVFELDSRVLAGEVKLKLLEVFGEQAPVDFYPPSEAQFRKHIRIPLVELDRQPRYHHTCGFVLQPLPLLARSQFDPEDLLALMRILRGREGCPWDREQTHQSLAKYLVEEANEAAVALLEEDWEAAADELGDVFLQLAFHAVVGEEYATFTWAQMLQAICTKLIRRHPHVFGDSKLSTAQEVLASWDEIKKKERAAQTTGERMVSVPRGFPALMRAEKVQQQAAKVGFDWPAASLALEKVHEEASELSQALAAGEGALEELGDLLFSCVNTARLMGISGDHALHIATERFISRFLWMENQINHDKKDWNLLTSNEIGVYWERSKAQETQGFTRKKEDVT